MRFQFFTIPVFESQTVVDELNQFCASKRVLTVEREFVPNGQNSFWAVCVNYASGEAPLADKKGRQVLDYRAILSEADFIIYARLRSLRNELAKKEGVPPYALFTNAQLAAMVQQAVDSKQELLQLEGIGPARVDKYADVFLQAVRSSGNTGTTQEHNETP